MRFTGKTVYVTQADTKQGEALALRFAQEGANLVLGNACECLVKKVEELGAKAMIVKPDLSSFEGGLALVEEVKAVFGRIDVLLYNNNTVVPSDLEHLQREVFESQLNDNTRTGFILTRVVGDHMAEYKSGKIVYVSSIHADKPTGSTVMYSISKGAINMLCKEAAIFYGPAGIECNVIEAGAVEGDAEKFHSEISALYASDYYMEQRVPRRKAGTDDEIAAVAAFLASQDASFVNGTTMRVDGGFELFYGFRAGKGETIHE